MGISRSNFLGWTFDARAFSLIRNRTKARLHRWQWQTMRIVSLKQKFIFPRLLVFFSALRRLLSSRFVQFFYFDFMNQLVLSIAVWIRYRYSLLRFLFSFFNPMIIKLSSDERTKLVRNLCFCQFHFVQTRKMSSRKWEEISQQIEIGFFFKLSRFFSASIDDKSQMFFFSCFLIPLHSKRFDFQSISMDRKEMKNEFDISLSSQMHNGISIYSVVVQTISQVAREKCKWILVSTRNETITILSF